jgi:hypothetical protein
MMNEDYDQEVKNEGKGYKWILPDPECTKHPSLPIYYLQSDMLQYQSP